MLSVDPLVFILNILSCMANGMRNYSQIRKIAIQWLEKVEMNTSRIDNFPPTFSGGMQQRLQIATNLVTDPKIIFMDEPTSGLDVSIQAKLIDVLKIYCRRFS